MLPRKPFWRIVARVPRRSGAYLLSMVIFTSAPPVLSLSGATATESTLPACTPPITTSLPAVSPSALRKWPVIEYELPPSPKLVAPKAASSAPRMATSFST